MESAPTIKGNSKMYIEKIKLENFRNYEKEEIEFDKNVNIIYGDNAQGKTNILESVYLTGTTKSHRGTKDKDLIKFGEEESHIETVVEKRGVPFKIDIHLKKNSPKGIAINKIPIKRASELFGIINIVFFSPEDLNIIKNGPAERRRFLDSELCQLDKIYLFHLSNYNKALVQRNALLRQMAGDSTLSDMLQMWDDQLITNGEKIIALRKQFIEEIGAIAKEIHKKLTNEEETLVLIYEPEVTEEEFANKLRQARSRDIAAKMTTVGPHRDDICFMIQRPGKDAEDVRKYGSQGQQRTSALSLKLAEIELVKQKIKDSPIILLDDVLSELDRKRQKQLLDSIEGMQTILTCTGLEEFVDRQKDENKLFYVENGTVEVKN